MLHKKLELQGGTAHEVMLALHKVAVAQQLRRRRKLCLSDCEAAGCAAALIASPISGTCSTRKAGVGVD